MGSTSLLEEDDADDESLLRIVALGPKLLLGSGPNNFLPPLVALVASSRALEGEKEWNG